MKENPAAIPAASADQSSQASPAATGLLQADEIPQAPESPEPKQGDIAPAQGEGIGGDGGNYLAAAGGCPKPAPSKGNHEQHQPYASAAERLSLKNQAAGWIQVCCTSKRPTNY